jgi:hypothetical protein
MNMIILLIKHLKIQKVNYTILYMFMVKKTKQYQKIKKYNKIYLERSLVKLKINKVMVQLVEYL